MFYGGDETDDLIFTVLVCPVCDYAECADEAVRRTPADNVVVCPKDGAAMQRHAKDQDGEAVL